MGRFVDAFNAAQERKAAAFGAPGDLPQYHPGGPAVAGVAADSTLDGVRRMFVGTDVVLDELLLGTRLLMQACEERIAAGEPWGDVVADTLVSSILIGILIEGGGRG